VEAKTKEIEKRKQKKKHKRKGRTDDRRNNSLAHGHLAAA